MVDPVKELSSARIALKIERENSAKAQAEAAALRERLAETKDLLDRVLGCAGAGTVPGSLLTEIADKLVNLDEEGN